MTSCSSLSFLECCRPQPLSWNVKWRNAQPAESWPCLACDLKQPVPAAVALTWAMATNGPDKPPRRLYYSSRQMFKRIQSAPSYRSANLPGPQNYCMSPSPDDKPQSKTQRDGLAAHCAGLNRTETPWSQCISCDLSGHLDGRVGSDQLDPKGRHRSGRVVPSMSSLRSGAGIAASSPERSDASFA